MALGDALDRGEDAVGVQDGEPILSEGTHDVAPAKYEKGIGKGKPETSIRDSGDKHVVDVGNKKTNQHNRKRMNVYAQLLHALLGEGELLGDGLCLEVNQEGKLVKGRVQPQKAHQHLQKEKMILNAELKDECEKK